MLEFKFRNNMSNARMSLVWLLTFSAGWVVAAGCTSRPAQPAPQPTSIHQEPVAPPPAASAEAQVTLPPGAAQRPAPFIGEGWQAMFDGESLAGWRETPFAGHGEVHCQTGVIVLSMGDPFTGINWTNPFPKVNYEVALDAMRLMGSDFFCGLTVPVRDTFCSLIVGGWGGSLVGISSLDGMDASENETTKFVSFESGRWYRIRLRVTEKKIEAWIDQEKLVDVATAERKISVRPGDIELSEPFGLAAWQSSAALRAIKFRPVSAGAP
jgi:hypothetical protein